MIPSEEHLWGYINGCHMDYTVRVSLDIFNMGIYVNSNSMVNIFSLKEV